MKHYAKKRESVRAVQWTGEMTPDVTELVGQRKVHVEGDRQLVLGNGWFAAVGNWICSASGEDLFVISDEVFKNVYEEVDEMGRSTDDEHEAAGKEFVQKLDDLLAASLRLTREEHQTIFRDRDQLVRCLRGLFEDHAWIAARREQARIRENLTKGTVVVKELW